MVDNNPHFVLLIRLENGYTIDDLMSCDYPEIIDETLKNKIINNTFIRDSDEKIVEDN